MALASRVMQSNLLPQRTQQYRSLHPCLVTCTFKHLAASLQPSREQGSLCQHQDSRAVAAAASPRAASQEASTSQSAAYNTNDDDQKAQKLLSALFQTKNYTQLAAFIKSQQQVFLNSPLCAYALLHAVQLRDTLSDENIGKGSLSSEAEVLQQLEVVENLLDQLCGAAVGFLSELPLTSQATLALALAQLGYYDEATYDAIAEAVLTQTGPRLEYDPADDSAPAQLPAGIVTGDVPRRSIELYDLSKMTPGVLLSLILAYSINGHYDDKLLNELAGQVLAFLSYFDDVTQLTSITAALLELQHYSPQLLSATAALAMREDYAGALSVDEIISLLLAIAFFRVEAQEFVTAALKEFATVGADLMPNVDPIQFGRLWKALLLLKEQQNVPIPHDLIQLLHQVQQQYPDLLSIGHAKAAISQEQLEAVQAAINVILQQWEEAGLLAPVQILQTYRDLGYDVLQNVPVDVTAFGQQQQQQQQQLQVMVDVCLRLPEGQRVAVLVLDESCYCVHPPNRLRGAAAVDILVLKALGLSVLPLPVAEWQQLEGDAAKQQKYLKARLAAAIGSPG